jgi:hypothetical protein
VYIKTDNTLSKGHSKDKEKICNLHKKKPINKLLLISSWQIVFSGTTKTLIRYRKQPHSTTLDVL